MRHLALSALLLLAACGADGPPERPATEPGVHVSGTVEFGVTGGNRRE
ncbi:putative small lipoprotein YifL [Rhodovulum iodosum]|uniref:Small lipoprotein YifL n=1 Tax=Rhodovulum iodosum TaxID=68291 RepID=A0ABV3XRZ8_9RHOB|nr:hypothetical protein [Rhodovulum robiginosum]